MPQSALPTPTSGGRRLHDRSGFCIVAHGVTIKLRLNDPSAADLLLAALPPGWRYATREVSDLRYAVMVRRRGNGVGIGSRHQLFFGAQILCESDDLDEIFSTLESDLHFRVAAISRQRVFVNAGVVGWMGRAIMLPGDPAGGRSTLVHALLRAGAVYYSDMYAVLDRQGAVYPYGVPLEADLPEHEFFQVLQPEPGRVPPIPVSLIAETSFVPGAIWRPRLVPPAEASKRLTAYATLASIDRESVRRSMENVTRGAVYLEGPRGDARGTAQAILAAIASDIVARGGSLTRSSTLR